MQDSVFTKIIKGEIPCHKIYEDDKTLAFLDVHPINPGHVLLVPKIQVEEIWNLDDELYHYLWDVVKIISTHIQTITKAPRVGIVVEGFGVPHVHIHLVPIYKGNDLKKFQDMSAEPDHPALAAMAKKLAF